MGGELMIYRLVMDNIKGDKWFFLVFCDADSFFNHQNMFKVGQIAKEFKVVVALYFVCINKIFGIKGAEVY